MNVAPEYRLDSKGILLEMNDVVMVPDYDRAFQFGRITKFEYRQRKNESGEKVFNGIALIWINGRGYSWRPTCRITKFTVEEAMLWKLENPTENFNNIFSTLET